MLNSEKFLNAFHSIEQYLQKQAGFSQKKPFHELTDNVAKSNPMVRYYSNDLKEFAELRNAIVHDRGGGFIIAEPNDWSLNQIDRIKSILLQPPKTFPLFKTDVIALQVSDSIDMAVSLIYKHTISQIPIKDGIRFHGLLTTNTIARWLGSLEKEEIISLSDTRIGEVFEYTEDKDNHAFISRNTNIFEAFDLFQRYEQKGKRLDAILITEKGQPNEKIIGIMTIADLPKAMGEIRS